MDAKIPLQPKDSQLCSAYASSFALNNLGIKLSLDNITSQLPISEVYGIGLYDLVLFFTQFPLEIVINSNGDYFPLEWENLNSSQDILDLLSASNDLKKWQESLKQCLMKQVSFQRRELQLNDLIDKYKNGWECIAYLNSSLLYNNEDKFFGHYVYIESIGNEDSIIRDSHWQYGGIKTYFSEQLLQAIHSGQDHIIWIKKP